MTASDPRPHGADRLPAMRLFLALWPGPRVRRALAACRDATQWPAGAAPVPDEKLHATLHFIGAVPAGRLAEVAAALRVPIEPFEWRLDAVARWQGGLTVLCPRAVPPRLQQLHADLAVALKQLALPVEARIFRPHVTLARRASGCEPEPPAGPLRWRVGSYVLVQSLPDGRYTVLRAYR